VLLNTGIEFQKVESSTLKEATLTAENHNFLIKYGFLGWVSPHLYFGGFENDQLLPCLENWSWINDWKVNQNMALEKYGKTVVVGSGPDDEPLVMRIGESPIYLISEDLELLLLGSNFEKLALIASAFLDMVDDALEVHPDAVQERVIPPELVNNFIATFETIESKDKSNSLWVHWANERSKNL